MKARLLKTLASDKLSSLANTAILSIFRLVAGVAIARMAGVESFAAYVLLVTAQITIASLVATCCDTPMLSIASGLNRKQRDSLIQATKRRSRYYRLSILGAGLLFYPIIRVYYSDTAVYFGFLLSTVAVVSAQFQRARLQALFKMNLAIVADTIAVLLIALSTYLAWRLYNDASLGFWCGSLVGFSISAHVMSRKAPIKEPVAPNPELAARTARNGRAMLSGTLANALCSRLHPYLIQLSTSAAAVASYGAAWTFLGPIRMAIVALTNILRPRLASFHGKGQVNEFSSLLLRARILITALGSVLLCFFLAFGSESVILLFGNELQVPTGILCLAALYATLDALTTTQMIQLQIEKRNGSKLASKYRITAALISILLALPLLYFMGLAGAFASLLVSEACYALLAWSALRSNQASANHQGAKPLLSGSG